MLSVRDAVKIIESFLRPRWNLVKSQKDKDEIHRLADELRKASGQSPHLSFSVVSDIHVQYWDAQAQGKFSAALEDLYRLNPNLDALVINGDLGDGRPEDYAALNSILQKHPLPKTVCYTIGNHEFYKAYYTTKEVWSPSTFPNSESDRASLERFLSFTQMSSVYYNRWIQGYHFIFLGPEQYRQSDPANNEDAWLSSAQLNWLQKKLQENYVPHRPMFVFLHQPLQGTVSGSEERGVVQQVELKRLLSAYPEVFFFTGHTHWELRLPDTLVSDVFTMVNSSSVSSPYDSSNRPVQGYRSEGLVIDVYEEHVHIRGRDFATQTWIAEADYTVSL
ncbi:MAG: phosphohydrolase [Paenibacillus sp.]|nr:phosphohydrolase [Paenibacillus sp.]